MIRMARWILSNRPRTSVSSSVSFKYKAKGQLYL